MKQKKKTDRKNNIFSNFFFRLKYSFLLLFLSKSEKYSFSVSGFDINYGNLTLRGLDGSQNRYLLRGR